LSVSEFACADPTLVQTIRRHLDGLKRNDAGTRLFRLLERGLNKCGTVDTQIDHTGVALLHAQLGAFASDDDNLPALRIKARVIQQHLVPYLSDDTGTTTASNPFQPYIDAINAIGAVPPPLAPVAYTRIDEPDRQQTHAGTHSSFGREPADAESDGMADHSGASVDPNIRDGLEKVLTADGAGTTGAERYQALRKSELDAWRAIYGTIKDFKSLKRLWVGSLDELLRERMELEQQLSSASDQIKSIESDRDRLRAELDQARKRAGKVARQPAVAVAKRGKRPSGLPKRELFVQQLEAEVERARRHGTPLALALVGIEGLEALTAHYGQDAEECVLRCYTGEILANFRTYDLVARYDSQQFAVLFPGTDRDGALRALVKAQKRAAETHLNLVGECIALPAFYGALSLHMTGENAATLVARACAGLEQARTAPPPHVVVVAQRLTLVRPDAQTDSRSSGPQP